MASSATVKMSVDVTQFKKGINEATASVKKLDAQLETNEKQLKLNGDAELYMKNKAALLQTQLESQRKVVTNTHKALEAMKNKGISPTSKEFQTMETNLAKAQSKMIDIETSLKEVKDGASGAKTQTQGMNTALKNIGKNVSFETVSNGLQRVTDTLEKGARAAVNLGKKVARSMMDTTEWADDVLTRATQNGVDAETIQRMDMVAEIIDTDVDTILSAKGRLAKNNDKLGELLGLDTNGMSLEDQFWAAGKAIMAITDEVEQEQKAQAIFGRGWKELLPLFTAGQEKYNQLMADTSVLSNEQVKKLGEADDKFKEMQHEAELLKYQFWADNSETIIGLLQWLLDNKDAVVIALGAIGTAFAALKVAELATNIGKVVNGFKDILNLGGKGGTGGAPTTGGGSGGSPVTGGGGSGGGGTAALTGLKGVWSTLTAGGGSAVWAAAPAAPLAALAASVYAQEKMLDRWEAEEKEQREAAAALRAAGHDDAATFVENAAEANGINGTTFIGTRASQYGEQTEETLRSLRDNPWLLNVVAHGLQGKGVNGEYANVLLVRFLNGQGMDPGMVSGLLEAASAALQEELARNPYGIYDTFIGEDSQQRLALMSQYAGKWLEEQPATEKSAEAMDNAAEVMSTLPQETADAVKSGISGMSINIGGFMSGIFGNHANGLFSVPWDGYPAILHKGEQVLTARAAQQYNSNVYFNNVNLNNGLEIEALTESIDRRNRRQRSGYGAA